MVEPKAPSAAAPASCKLSRRVNFMGILLFGCHPARQDVTIDERSQRRLSSILRGRIGKILVKAKEPGPREKQMCKAPDGGRAALKKRLCRTKLFDPGRSCLSPFLSSARSRGYMAKSMARISLTTIFQFRRSTVANTDSHRAHRNRRCERNRPGGVRCLFAKSGFLLRKKNTMFTLCALKVA